MCMYPLSSSLSLLQWEEYWYRRWPTSVLFLPRRGDRGLLKHWWLGIAIYWKEENHSHTQTSMLSFLFFLRGLWYWSWLNFWEDPQQLFQWAKVNHPQWQTPYSPYCLIIITSIIIMYQPYAFKIFFVQNYFCSFTVVSYDLAYELKVTVMVVKLGED